MSTTIEIPREEWRPFLDQFSMTHRGWTVDIEVVSELGDEIEVHARALCGVIADLHAAENEISILVGEVDGPTLTHRVPDPIHVYLKSDEDGRDETLCLQPREGGMTLVNFIR